MYFVYRPRNSRNSNGQEPAWCLIDFKEKGLRNIYIDWWTNKVKCDDWSWGQDIYEEIKADPEKFLIVEAEDYSHLCKTKEYKEKWNEFVLAAIKPDSKLGWIAPDGTFIGCHHYDHSFIAENYLHSSEDQLEEEGWCKIYALNEREADNNNFSYFTKNQHFTEAQKEFIRRHDEKFPTLMGRLISDD